MRRKSCRVALVALVALCGLLHAPAAAKKRSSGSKASKRSRSGAGSGSAGSGAGRAPLQPPPLWELDLVAGRALPPSVPGLPASYSLDAVLRTSPDGQSAHLAAATALGQAREEPFSHAAFAAACRDSPDNFRNWMNLASSRQRRGAAGNLPREQTFSVLAAFRHGAAVMTPAERSNPGALIRVGEMLSNAIAEALAAAFAEASAGAAVDSGADGREDLSKLKLGELIERARQRGVAEPALDDAMEQDEPRASLRALLAQHPPPGPSEAAAGGGLDLSRLLPELERIGGAVLTAVSFHSSRWRSSGLYSSQDASDIVAHRRRPSRLPHSPRQVRNTVQYTVLYTLYRTVHRN